MVRENTVKRHQDLISDYKKMYSVSENGVRKYNLDYIVMKLSEEHHYSEQTIHKILKKKNATVKQPI